MGSEVSQSFNLHDLLLMEELNIQKFAENNPFLPVGEYFSLLYKFTYLAPKAAGALAQIIAHKADKNAVQSLVEIKMLLKSIGCNKFFQPLSEIVNALQNGNKSYASICTEKILDDFNGFSTQIMTAKKTEKMELLTNGGNQENKTSENYAAEYRSQPLLKALGELDREEATRKLRILVVDDSPVMLKTISSILENDYKVHGIANPLLVEDVLEKITPELFILDYKMPRLNGFELVPKIRKFNNHKMTPIIFLTSLGTVDNISTAMSLGACDFIVKPFEPDILREKVAKHIVRKRAR